MMFSLNPLLKKPFAAVIHNGEPVSYSYGNLDALHKWIAAMNNKQVESSLGMPGSKKYPLIWLVEGWECKEVVGGLLFEKVVFHVACNSTIPALTEDRKPNFDLLYSVSNDMIDALRLHLRIQDKSIKYTERANLSTATGTHTSDVWDTLIVSMNLFINPNCLKKLL